MWRRWLAVAIAAGIAFGACTATTTPVPATPRTFALRTDPTAIPPNFGCRGVGTDAVLRGDAADPEIAWLAPLGGGIGRRAVIWPVGYRARFEPDLQVLDESGRVVLEDGDYVDGGCVTALGGPDRALLLIPPFLSARLICGPVAVNVCGAGVTRAAMDSGWPQHTIDTFTWIAPNQYVITFDDGSRATGSLQP